MIRSYVEGAVVVALAVSIVGNILQYRLVQRERAATAAAVTVANDNGARAKTCSDSVKDLEAAARRSAAAATAARKAASQRSVEAQSAGQGLLAKPPSVPGNACASAAAQVNDWLSARTAR